MEVARDMFEVVRDMVEIVTNMVDMLRDMVEYSEKYGEGGKILFTGTERLLRKK